MCNLNKIDTLLETQNVPRIHHREIKNVNIYALITDKNIEVTIKIFLPDSFTRTFYKTL